MSGIRPGATLLLAVLLSACAAPTFAQDEQDEGRTAGYNAIIDNIDLLIDNYARFLGRKYDLTEEQDEYTKSLLRERSYEFLNKNEDTLRNVVDRMFDVRSGGDMTPEGLIEWGKTVQPIYDEAKKLITDGNNEWREILTPEQQKLHDEDVRLMLQSFETTEDQLDSILSGEMTVDEFRSPQKNKRRSRRSRNTAQPRQAPAPVGDDPAAAPETRVSRLPENGNASAPDRPTRRITREGRVAPGDSGESVEADAGSARDRGVAAKRGRTAKAPAPRTPGKRTSSRSAGKGYESKWDKYVKDFIAKYQLNDEQTQKANAVLADCKAQAAKRLSGHKSQFDMIDKQLESLKKSKDKSKSKTMAALNKQRNKLMEPLDQIFEKQLKPRLEKLPTRAQRRAAEAAAKKKPAAKKKAAGKPGETKKKGSGD